MKREVIHHLDDVKISLQAELDQLYRGNMDKYARLRREVAAVTRLRDDAGVGHGAKTGQSIIAGANGNGRISTAVFCGVLLSG